MRVLVLGGNRYIGLHLLFELARRGHDVTVMNSHVAPMPDGVRRLHGDRQVPGVLEEVLTGHDFDVVFDNTAYQVKDVEPIVRLFPDRHIVFTSSVAVYRRSYIQPVLETHRTHDATDEDPRKAYGVGKVRCENHLFDRVKATSLRVTHTIGPGSPLASREPSFFKRLEEGRPILIPGEGFPFVHLVHVQDVANLMCSVIGSEPGNIYNVAGREVTSVLGCIELMARAVGVRPEIVHVPMEIARRARPPLVHWGESLLGGSVISIDKALRDLDWEPGYGLEAAYAQSYEWFKNGGRENYEYDFSADDAILAQLALRM